MQYNLLLLLISYLALVFVISKVYKIILGINDLKSDQDSIFEKISSGMSKKIWKFHLLINTIILLIVPVFLYYVINKKFPFEFSDNQKLTVRYIFLSIIVLIITFTFLFPEKMGGEIFSELFGVSEKQFTVQNQKGKNLSFMPSGENLYKEEFMSSAFKSVNEWFTFSILVLIPSILFTTF